MPYRHALESRGSRICLRPTLGEMQRCENGHSGSMQRLRDRLRISDKIGNTKDILKTYLARKHKDPSHRIFHVFQTFCQQSYHLFTRGPLQAARQLPKPRPSPSEFRVNSSSKLRGRRAMSVRGGRSKSPERGA